MMELLFDKIPEGEDCCCALTPFGGNMVWKMDVMK